MPRTTIIVDLVDGCRNPLRAKRILVHHQYTLGGVLRTPPPKEGTAGPFEFSVEGSDGSLGLQTIVASATGYVQEGLVLPSLLKAGETYRFSLMLTPKRPSAEFGSRAALLARLNVRSEKWATLLEPLSDPLLQSGSIDRPLACLLNILTGMEDIDRRWGTSLIQGIERVVLEPRDAQARADREFEGIEADRAFFEFNREVIGIDDENGVFARKGANTKGKVFHEDRFVHPSHAPADCSFRQGEPGFPITPMQICLITDSTILKARNVQDGRVLADVDFDEFPSNSVEHGIFEVLPHFFTKGKTDPYVIYRRRWALHEALLTSSVPQFNGAAGRFEPPYTLSAG